MGVFGWRKKKGVPTTPSGTDSTTSMNNLRETVSSGSLQLRASSFASKFTPRSFKSGRKPFSGLPLTPTMSPVSVADSTWPRQDAGNAMDIEPDDVDSFNDIRHHGVTTLPTLSPTMAAIAARTEELHQVKEYSGSGDTFERPVRRRTVLRLSNFLTRRDTTTGLTALSSNWLIDFNDLSIGKTIGHSSFGTVSQGKFNGTKVAVKTIHCNSPQSLASIQKEAELNCKLRHPNIVLFMGICIQPTTVCLVTELMARGNVRDLLVRCGAGTLSLDWSLRQNWALDTARGMAYLHSLDPPIMHRDLKTTNLLVDRGMNVKICDFGLSHFRADKIMRAVGTVHFSAPEVLRNEMYTEKADIFSFGTVMWELYTCKCVFEGMPTIEVYQAVVNGQMPFVDDDCDVRYRQLLQDCWSLDPEKRPPFRQIIDYFSALIDDKEDSLH